VDYRDCEIEQIALAHGAGMVRLAPRPADLAAMRLNQSQPSTAGGVQMPDGRNFLATRR
jgi:hypothetical protein